MLEFTIHHHESLGHYVMKYYSYISFDFSHNFLLPVPWLVYSETKDKTVTIWDTRNSKWGEGPGGIPHYSDLLYYGPFHSVYLILVQDLSLSKYICGVESLYNW